MQKKTPSETNRESSGPKQSRNLACFSKGGRKTPLEIVLCNCFPCRHEIRKHAYRGPIAFAMAARPGNDKYTRSCLCRIAFSNHSCQILERSQTSLGGRKPNQCIGATHIGVATLPANVVIQHLRTRESRIYRACRHLQ